MSIFVDMTKETKKGELDFEIDCLTNSIRNVISKDSFATDVLRLTKGDLKHVSKKINGYSIGKRN
ncbi:hypothetical protein [Viscerimonas tarda]